MLSSARVVLWAKVVAGLAVVVGGAALVTTRGAAPALPVRPVPAVSTPPPSASVEPRSLPSDAPEPPPPSVVPASPPPSATQAVRALPAVSSTRGGSSKTTDPLAYEAKVLEGARACLAVADVACARARLNEHAGIERPRLRDEAAVMNIEVLRAEGHRDEARRAATSFVEQRPTSPYVKRVRAIELQLEAEGR